MVHISDAGRIALLDGQIDEELKNRSRLFAKASVLKRELEELSARIVHSDELRNTYERQKQQLLSGACHG